MSHELGSLLGRWHQWRRAYSHERGYARARYSTPEDETDDDAVESMLMRAIEEEVERLPHRYQLALQHVARAECLGVEVISTQRLPVNREQRESLCMEAIAELQRRLENAGLI